MSNDSRINDKLDKLLEEVTVIRTISSQHTSELLDLQTKLDPVFTHVTGVKAIAKLGAAIVGVASCIAAMWVALK